MPRSTFDSATLDQGEGWFMNVNIGSVTVNPPGCVGQYLHGGQGFDPAYFSTTSRPVASHLNYAWQLKDVGKDDGGVPPLRAASVSVRLDAF